MSRLRDRRPNLARLDISTAEPMGGGESITAVDKLVVGECRNFAQEFRMLDDVVRQFKEKRDFCDDILPFGENCAQTLTGSILDAERTCRWLRCCTRASQKHCGLLVDGGGGECASYLPTENEPLCLLAGALQVQLKSGGHTTADSLGSWLLEITYGGEAWEVTRVSCSMWADEDVLPPQSLLRLAELVSASAAETTVVHCRAGAGRTGCLIALCSLLADLEQQLSKVPGSVPCASVAGVVVDLRKRRQTKRQDG